jgi:type VI secretion system protein ImpE
MSAARISECLANDDLSAGLDAATEAVKSHPRDAAARLILAELSVLAGDLDRAETHAKLVARLAPEDAVGLGVFRQHLRGFHARAQWWQAGAVPVFPMGMTDCDKLALKLNVALRAGDGNGAHAALDALEAARAEHPADWNGKAVDDLRDLDDRLPHAFEAVTRDGNYLWLDFARVREVAFQPPVRALDLAFRRARVTLIDECCADLLIPATYPAASDGAHLLARRTDFVKAAGGLTLAQGQHAYLAGDDMVGLLQAETIGFAGAGHG